MTTTIPTLSVDIDFTTNLSAGFAYYEQVKTTAPYVWYRLQESGGTSIADASGNGVTGTISQTYTLNQTTGKPVSGETASRYILLGGTGATAGRIAFTGVIPPGPYLTIEAWVYWTNATRQIILENDGTAAAGSILQLEIQADGTIRIYVGKRYYTTTQTVAAATWKHLVVAVDSGNDSAGIYLNGSALTVTGGVAAPDPPMPPSFSNLNLNWYWGSVTVGLGGIARLAEPAIYFNPFSSTIANDHYNAAATVPFAGYTWTDVTDDVLVDPGISRRFGRENSTGDVTPMELTYTLVNDDRIYEIENSSSTYYPNVVPGRPTRIRLTQDGVTYDWAFGFIEDFPQTWDTTGKFGRVQIVAHCFLERMNQDSLGARQFVQQLAGNRMAAVSNIAGVPTTQRDLDAGQNQIMTQSVDSGSTGDHARQVARSDRGLFFFDGRGYAIFQDGAYRTTDTRATSSRGTLGRVGSVDIVTLGPPDFHAPASLIMNDITIRRPGGVDQIAIDNTSRGKYGRRSYQDELLLTTDAAAASRAASYLADYKDPTLRVRSISFNPSRSPGQWDHALGVQLSDRYTWLFQPKQGSSISRDVFVEGVSDRWVGKEYRATWFLSLA